MDPDQFASTMKAILQQVKVRGSRILLHWKHDHKHFLCCFVQAQKQVYNLALAVLLSCCFKSNDILRNLVWLCLENCENM